MSAKAYATLAAVIFMIVAAFQLYRAYSGIPVNVAGTEIPAMASWVVGGVLALLSLLGFTARG